MSSAHVLAGAAPLGTSRVDAAVTVTSARVIRGTGRVSIVVGWALAAMGIVAILVFVVLAFVVAPWMLIFLFAPVLLFIGAGINLWMGYRTRLEILPDRFIWCGAVGKENSLAWRDIRQILIPPPNSRPRLAAIAQLHDGRYVEIEALWLSRTSPISLAGAPDHSRARQLLIDGHRAHLARTEPE